MRQTPFLALALLFALGLVGRDVVRAETVQVVTAKGRTLTGVVDARSDDQRLWLRQERDGVVMTASVAWADIAAARVDSEAVEAAHLREQRGELSSTAPRWLATEAEPGHGVVVPASFTQPVRRVRSLAIVAACLGNFDGDVEPDGLVVSIAALDGAGVPMAVRGNITAKLHGELRPANVRDVTFGILDEWTQPVRAIDFSSGVATFELRFRRTAPEWQFDMVPDALVEVNLLAFGEGRFSASAPVVVRAFNPLRDNQQLLLRSRFMPGEHHGPPPSSMPMNRDGRWLNWAW